MDNITEYIIYGLVAGACFLFSYKFSRGKWLSVIAGHTFLKQIDLQAEAPYINAKLVSRVLFFLGVLEILLEIKLFIETNAPEFLWVNTALIWAFAVLVAVSLIRVFVRGKRIG